MTPHPRPDDAAQEVARDLAEAFEIALSPGWNRLYPDEPRTPNLWADIHPDAQTCWIAVAKRALYLAAQAAQRACQCIPWEPRPGTYCTACGGLVARHAATQEEPPADPPPPPLDGFTPNLQR